MAMNLSKPSSHPPLPLLLTIFFAMTTAQKQSNLPQKLLPENGFGKRSGPNPTAIRVAKEASTKASMTGFGAIVMIDDPLTEGPMLSSKLLGRAQGFYASAEFGYLMTFNYVFVERKCKGSALSILGRNPVLIFSICSWLCLGQDPLFQCHHWRCCS
ncbi:hypothetical protein AMTRI_Chr11g97410 [Amborella trichopoda]